MDGRDFFSDVAQCNRAIWTQLSILKEKTRINARRCRACAFASTVSPFIYLFNDSE